MKHMIVGHAEAEIHVPFTVVDDDGTMRDESAVLLAQVDANDVEFNVRDFKVLSMTAEFPVETIKNAIRQGWANISNEQQQSLQQACLAGL